MREEQILAVAQLLNAIKDSIEKIKEATRDRDEVLLARAKKEIILLNKKISETI